MTTLLQPGKLVSLRGREWIVLPSEDNNLLIIKPLGGSDEEITGIYLPLGIESDQPADARFEEPTAADLGDISTARVLYDSARLAFRRHRISAARPNRPTRRRREASARAQGRPHR